MSGRRQRQIESLLRIELSDIIQREVRDPRLGFASITQVHVSKDLSHARVMVSIFGTDEERKQSIEALQHAQGYIRKQLAPRIRLRKTPALLFELDESLEHAEHISRILSELEIPPETEDQDGKEPGEN